MKYDLFYGSKGGGRIHGCRWEPKGQPKGGAATDSLPALGDLRRVFELHDSLVKLKKTPWGLFYAIKRRTAMPDMRKAAKSAHRAAFRV